MAPSKNAWLRPKHIMAGLRAMTRTLVTMAFEMPVTEPSSSDSDWP